jgi:hypothetical protein
MYFNAVSIPLMAVYTYIRTLLGEILTMQFGRALPLLSLLLVILFSPLAAYSQFLGCAPNEIQVCCKGSPIDDQCECKPRGEKPICQAGCELKKCKGDECTCRYKKCRGGQTPVCDRESVCTCQKGELEINRTETLRFGSMTVQSNGWAYMHAENGTMEMGGDVKSLGGNYGRAVFEVLGPPNTPFSVTLPNNMNLNGQGTAKVEKMHYWHPQNPPTTGPTGRTTIYVGGLLQLRGREHTGHYEGIFDITVNPLR